MQLLQRKKSVPRIMGIHVGRQALTLARIVVKDGVIVVRELFRELLPREPGGWPVEKVSTLLRRAKRQISLKSDVTRLTVCSDLAASHYFILPPLKGEQLDSAVKLKLENKLNNSASEMSYQSATVERHGERCRVFATSIPTQKLRLILGSFLEASCPVDSMEVEGVSVTNLLARAELVNGRPIGVMQINPDWSEVYIVVHKKLTLSRPILKLEPAAAAADDSDPPGSQPKDDPEGPSSHYLARIVREANKTLDYFEIELLSPAVERLLLFGQSALLAELPDYLAQQLELDVSVLGKVGALEDETGEFEPTLHSLAVAAAAGGVKHAG
ncbi:MAG: hypothetical protein ACOC8E_00490 [Planctomycetota bacterium]